MKRDPRTIHRTYGSVSKAGTFDREERTGVFTITTPTVDSYGDIVMPQGAKMERFRKNPVIPWAHQYGQPPVAKSLSEKVTPDVGIDSQAKFAGAEEYPFADQVFRLYVGGYLNATSVGFLPIRYEKRLVTPAEGGNPTWMGGYVFHEWELLEYSMLPVPANKDALVNGLQALMTAGRVLGVEVDGRGVEDSPFRPFELQFPEGLQMLEAVPGLTEEILRDVVREEIARALEARGTLPKADALEEEQEPDMDLLLQDAADELHAITAALRSAPR